MPTISAVGHEVDISICDLVADHRAPTPSAAAETATRSRAELEAELRKRGARIAAAAGSELRFADDRLRQAARDLSSGGRALLAGRRAGLQSVAGRLHALSPVATLARGYAVARALDGTTLASVSQFTPDQAFDLIVRDGVVPSAVRAAPIHRER